MYDRDTAFFVGFYLFITFSYFWDCEKLGITPCELFKNALKTEMKIYTKGKGKIISRTARIIEKKVICLFVCLLYLFD